MNLLVQYSQKELILSKKIFEVVKELSISNEIIGKLMLTQKLQRIKQLMLKKLDYMSSTSLDCLILSKALTLVFYIKFRFFIVEFSYYTINNIESISRYFKA